MRASIHRRRRQIALLAMVCLLFQQFAMAAYACTPRYPMPAASVALSQDCQSMRMAPASENPPLCAKHCSPDILVVADHHVPTVPPLALPPPVHATVIVIQPKQRLASFVVATFHGSDPPPRLHYCSLLI